MNQDIKYLGYTAQPSGYLSADGDLSLSLQPLTEQQFNQLSPHQ